MLMLLAGGTALVVDQISKHVVARMLSESATAWRWSIFTITRRTFRVGEPQGLSHHAALLALWALAALAGVIYVTLAAPSGGALPRAALGSAIGGAASNLFDRLCRRGIVDFIAVGFWPVFNLADVAIVGGVLLTLCAAG